MSKLIVTLILIFAVSGYSKKNILSVSWPSSQQLETIETGKVKVKMDVVSEQFGVASCYGPRFHGNTTANGEIYDMGKLTAAHRTLPFNTQVEVTNVSNGKSVVVRINDRGPYIQGRIIDLSKAAARQLDIIDEGISMVNLRIWGT